jgi:hypothetical protein
MQAFIGARREAEVQRQREAREYVPRPIAEHLLFETLVHVWEETVQENRDELPNECGLEDSPDIALGWAVHQEIKNARPHEPPKADIDAVNSDESNALADYSMNNMHDEIMYAVHVYAQHRTQDQDVRSDADVFAAAIKKARDNALNSFYKADPVSSSNAVEEMEDETAVAPSEQRLLLFGRLATAIGEAAEELKESKYLELCNAAKEIYDKF